MTIEMICENCSEPFYCYPSDAEKGRKYCGLKCRSAHRFKKDLPAASRTPVGFTCQECSKPFAMMASYVTAYKKKFGRNPLYCSMECSHLAQRKNADERNRFECEHCGKKQDRRRKTGGRIYREQKYCDVQCKNAALQVRALDKFNAGTIGRHVKRNGYIWISLPTLVTGKKQEMLEHRYVMSRHIARDLLREETVHHRDGNRANNEISNLELFNSRHGPGQRVVDKVQFAIEMLIQYPEFCIAAGYSVPEKLHISDAPETH